MLRRLFNSLTNDGKSWIYAKASYHFIEEEISKNGAFKGI